MADADGPKVARVVYEAIFKTEDNESTSTLDIDLDSIAYGLDEAVRQLREEGVRPERWATFVHYGI